MEQVQRLTQAYKMAPWRKQLQVIGAFMLVVVAVAVVAGIYLNVTARANAFGREIQQVQIRMVGPRQVTDGIDNPLAEDDLTIEEMEIQIADLRTRLAHLTSEEVMHEKALKLGFTDVDPQAAEYMIVQGYRNSSQVQLAPPAGPVSAAAVILPDSYRESLIDLGKKMIEQVIGTITGRVQP